MCISHTIQGKTDHESKYIISLLVNTKCSWVKLGVLQEKSRNAEVGRVGTGGQLMLGIGFAGIVSGAPPIETIRDTEMILMSVTDRMQMCEGSEGSLAFRIVTDLERNKSSFAQI